MNEFISNLELTLEKASGTIIETDAFRNYPEWDSLMVFAVLSMLTDEYEVTISRAEFDDIITVKDLYEFVQKNQ